MTDIDNKILDIQAPETTQEVPAEESVFENCSAPEKNFSSLHKGKILSCKLKHILYNIKISIYTTLGIVLLLIAAIVGITIATNNYTTPIEVLEKYANAEEFTLQKYSIDHEGKLAKKQIKQIFKILRNSDYFLDLEEEIYDISISNYENRLDKYGDNFVITYSILSYEELTKTDLRDKRADLQEYVYDLESIVDETEDFTASDWGDLAEEFGLLKTETKQLIENIDKLAKEYGRIEVSKGYSLSVLITTTGDELEEPTEEEVEINVYKVNGRWIGETFGMTLDVLSDIY